LFSFSGGKLVQLDSLGPATLQVRIRLVPLGAGPVRSSTSDDLDAAQLAPDAQALVERYVYDPFGQVTILDAGWNTLSTSAFAWNYLHQGGRFDSVSGLYHFRHRDYSPTLGRWTSLDPIRYAAGDVNLYRALDNCLLNNTDPFGLYEWPWSPNASWRLEGSLLGDVIDAALEPIRIGGDLIRAGTQLASLGTHALGWTDIYEYEPHSWLMQGWFRACDEGRGREYLLDVEVGVVTLGVKPLGEAIYEEDWRNVSRMAGGYLFFGGISRVRSGQVLLRPRPSVAPTTPRITFGHGARHLEGSGLSQAAVESAIENAIRAIPNSGSHWGWVQVNGQWIQYRAFVLPDGTINVGTYVRVPGNLSNERVR
jgi:RHS repeat-associated protein